MCSAAGAGSQVCVEWLARQGVSLELSDNRGWTALFFACSTGQQEVVKLLLSLGANSHKKDFNGRDAADVADAAFKHFEKRLRNWKTDAEKKLCSDRMGKCVNIAQLVRNN